jgi:hypothetical protein
LGGTFLSDANAVLDAKAGAGFYSSGNTVLHCALRGSGSYASSGWAASLTIGAGGKVSPGAAGADAATFTFNMSAGDAQRVILGAGSTTVIDVISPGLADLVNGTGYMTIDPAARLDVYLPTPGAETTISNLPIITNATPITGTFSPGLVSLNVVGWDGLSVTKSADGTQILLSAHYVPEPLTLGLLAIGALAIRRGRKA